MINEISPHIFRAYDIRGLYGKDIDPILFYKIGLSAGRYVKKDLNGSNMTVGNDIRQSSHALVHAFIAGVTAAGVDVYYAQTTSFGQTLFEGWESKKDLIAFVTASHLPPEWNGIKFYFGDGVGLPEEELNKKRDTRLNKNGIPLISLKLVEFQSLMQRKNMLLFLRNHFISTKKFELLLIVVVQV